MRRHPSSVSNLHRIAIALGCVLAFGTVACSASTHAPKNAAARGDAADPFANSVDSGPPTRWSSDASSTVQLPNCGASRFGASVVQANLLLVIDKSGSMTDKPKGFDSDKWSAMKASLATALEAAKSKLWLGLELYPLAHCEMPAGSTMDVEVQPGDQALPHVLAALDATAPSGGTPTGAALGRALEYFTKGAGAKLVGGKYVLLATDGGPNCNTGLSCDVSACTVNLDGQCPNGVANCCDPAQAGAGAQAGCLDDQETRARIKALADAGIDTFVVGIPGSESYAASLDGFAQAGGRVNPSAPHSYYAVSASGTGLGGLTTTLSSIASSLVKSCQLRLASVPPALDQLNVRVDGTIVPQQGPDGWVLDTSTSPPTIELKGETCKRIERDGAQSVAVLYGCPTQVF